MEDDSEASSGGSKDVKSHRLAPGEAAGVGGGGEGLHPLPLTHSSQVNFTKREQIKRSKCKSSPT